MTGWSCRLPTEVEWEAAVRGSGTNVYPWGDNFGVVRANTVEGRVLTTTPVGIYPTGVGPTGVWDGAGNVWEWTSSIYKPYPYRGDDGREDPTATGRRAVRGGSWYANQRYARCAYRSDDHPDCYIYLLGFRMCVSK